MSDNKKWNEEIGFAVQVKQIKGDCRAGHNVGDTWEFDYNTPCNMCSEAFYTIYPMIYALRMRGDVRPPSQHSGQAKHTDPDVVEAYCPDNGWVKFEIRRIYNNKEQQPEKPKEEFRPDLNAAK